MILAMIMMIWAMIMILMKFTILLMTLSFVTVVTLGHHVVFGDNCYFLVITVILVNWDKTSFIFEFVFETSS